MTDKNHEISLPRRRFQSRIVANLFLIWLDEQIDSSDALNLSEIVNMIKLFTDREQCVDFLTDIQNEDIGLIIVDSIAEQIVPLIHDLDQLKYIFIHHKNPTINQQWTTKWSKIQGNYTDISTICDAIKKIPKRCEQDAVTFTLLDTSDDLSKKKLDQLDPMFMYSQMLVKTILKIEFDQQNFQDLINYCRQEFNNNDIELQKVNNFETNYRKESAIKWYTSERFLYTTLNRGLRIVNADTITQMGYYIVELYREIEQMHREQYSEGKNNEQFTLYRGQVIPNDQFDKIRKVQGGLISFNSFLSTSKTPQVSSVFASNDTNDPQLTSILFVITVDPSKSSAVFAPIDKISQFSDEEEVLFVMNAVFRIVNIKQMSESPRAFEIELTLTDETDKDLKILRDYIQEEILSTFEGWQQLANIFSHMGLLNKAQQLFEKLLNETTDELVKMTLYSALGTNYREQESYKLSIEYFEKVLEMQQRLIPNNLQALAVTYGNLAILHSIMGSYSKALLFHEKALNIREEILDSNHPDLGNSHSNIGSVYSNMADYPKALLHYEKSLEIRQQSLPSNHPKLAMSHNNIGKAYHLTGNYSKALQSYKQALKIQEQSLPPDHPNLVKCHNNIGAVYFDMGKYSEALSSYKSALAIRKTSLALNIPDATISYNIGRVHLQQSEYSEALKLFQKTLEIRK